MSVEDAIKFCEACCNHAKQQNIGPANDRMHEARQSLRTCRFYTPAAIAIQRSYKGHKHATNHVRDVTDEALNRCHHSCSRRNPVIAEYLRNALNGGQ